MSAAPARIAEQVKNRPTIDAGSTAVAQPALGRAKNARFGPYSRVIDRGAIGAFNGRSREGRFMRHYEAILVEHCGGNPSITQRILISRIARLALHLQLMDEQALTGKPFTQHDHNYYVSWTNSLARMLEKLGFDEPNKIEPPSLDDVKQRIVTGE